EAPERSAGSFQRSATVASGPWRSRGRGRRGWQPGASRHRPYSFPGPRAYGGRQRHATHDRGLTTIALRCPPMAETLGRPFVATAMYPDEAGVAGSAHRKIAGLGKALRVRRFARLGR